MAQQLQFTHAPDTRDADQLSAMYLDDDDVSGQALFDILDKVAKCTYSLDRKPRVFVDRSGRWLAGNEAAREFLHTPTAGLYFDRGRLKALPHAEPCLEGLLAVSGRSESCVIAVENGFRHVIFQASSYDRQIVCITAVAAESEAAPEFVDFSAAFSLTQCENKVVHGLLAGSSPQQLANELGVSINTIRAHLRHCYEKMGVTHREELWRRAHPYRVC